MRVIAALGLSILLLPGVHAAPIDLGLPETLTFASAFLVSGHVETAMALTEPVLVEPTTLTATGTLVVCPSDDQDARGDVLEALQLAQTECDGAVTYTRPEVTFGPGTRLRTAGTFDVGASPAARMAFAADGVVAWTPSDPVTLSGAETRFVGADADAAVRVRQGQSDAWYNGTGWLFLHAATDSTWDAAALGGSPSAPPRITLSHAGDALARLGDPFLLLDVQALVYGPDARDARTELGAIVREFGRVDDVVDGALYGHLNGTVGGRTFSPDDVSLVRFSSAELSVSGGRLTGEGTARLSIASDGIAARGGVHDAWWLPAILLWIAAAATLVLRRHPVVPRTPRRLANLGAGLALALLLDLYVLRRLTGTSVLASLVERDRAGVVLVLLAIELVLWLLVWGLHVVPARVVGRKVVPRGWPQWAVDGGAWLLLVVAVLVWPAVFLAQAYAFVRL